MVEKYILISLEDERTKRVAEILSNSTCKKILKHLAENEASETDIANKLGIPVNTVEYNIKKLLSAGLIEKSKKFFWSKKGRKINLYKAARKSILISTKPRRAVRGVIPTILLSTALALIIKFYLDTKTRIIGEKIPSTITKTAETAAALPREVAGTSGISILPSFMDSYWIWFLIGAFVAILILFLWNLKRKN